MDPSSVPLLAWHFVAVQSSVNPMLAFCRGDVVHFLLVSLESCLWGTRFLHRHAAGQAPVSGCVVPVHARGVHSLQQLEKTNVLGFLLQQAAVPFPGDLET